MEQPFLCCEICDLNYSVDRQPRNLPCGHSVCTSCLEQILIRDRNCPECRSELGPESASQFPVNYPILRLCSTLYISNGSCTTIEDFKSSYRADLKRGVTQANQIMEKLESEETSIMNCIKESKREIKKHKSEIVRIKDAIEELNSKQIDIASKKSDLEGIASMLESTKNTMEDAHSVTEMTAIIDSFSHHKAKFDKFKLAWMTEEQVLTQIVFERRMAVASQLEKRELLTNALRRGQKVYSTIGEDTPLRYAEVKIEQGRILQFSLRNGSPPSEGLKIHHDVVRSLADGAFPMVFLEIKINGTVKGKIFISLLNNLGRTMQFLYLCTGERGPSYANTCFFEIANKGYGDKIWGGDYENNDGSGGAALPTMTRGPQNLEKITDGLVCGFYYDGYGDDHNPSQFCIYLEDIAASDMSALGKVVSGLNIAHDISKLENVHGALVLDCGIMLYSS